VPALHEKQAPAGRAETGLASTLLDFESVAFVS